MNIVTAFRSPAAFTPGWKLAKERPNEFGYRDVPIERGRAADVAERLPQDLKEKLAGVNIRSIDPLELAQLSLMLHREGYLSCDAWGELGVLQVDYHGPVDPLTLTQDALKSIRGVDDTMYRLAIRGYEAAIEAVQGIEALIDHLNGRVIDVYA